MKRGRDLAVHSDRYRLLIRMGGVRDVQNEKPTSPTDRQASPTRRQRARERRLAIGALLSDDGNEFRGDFNRTTVALKARHTRIHAGWPRTNGHVEALRKTILDECLRSAFARYLYP
jgi:hypothetical protein